MQSWHDFYAMTGAASASLTGLLFVALSINRDRIAAHSGYRSVARQTMLAFISAPAISGLALMPVQSEGALGIELFVGIGGVLLVEVFVQRTVMADLDEYGGRYIRLSLAYNATLVLIAASAFMLVVGIAGAPFPLAAGVMALGVLAIRNSWGLVIQVDPISPGDD